MDWRSCGLQVATNSNETIVVRAELYRRADHRATPQEMAIAWRPLTATSGGWRFNGDLYGTVTLRASGESPEFVIPPDS